MDRGLKRSEQITKLENLYAEATYKHQLLLFQLRATLLDRRLRDPFPFAVRMSFAAYDYVTHNENWDQREKIDYTCKMFHVDA